MAGASKKKRRAEPRKRSKKGEIRELPRPRSDSDKVSIGGSWFRELGVVLCAISALFVCCSILSEKFKITGDDAINVMGPVGNVVGSVLLDFMGWCSLTIPIWFLIAIYLFRKDTEDAVGIYKTTRIVGVIGTCVSACVTVALFGGAAAGGRIGAGIATVLTRYFGTVGTAMLSICLLILFLSLACQMSVYHLLKAICIGGFKGAREGIKGLFWGTTKSAHVVAKGGSAVGGWVSNFITAPSDRYYSNDDDDEYYEEYDDVEEVANGKFVMGDFPKKVTPLSKNKRRRSSEEDEVVVEGKERGRRDVLVNRRQRPTVPEKRIRQRFAKDENVAHGLFHYTPPALSLLAEAKPSPEAENSEELIAKSRLIEEKLQDFGIEGNVTEVHPGPVITLFEFEPAAGVKVSRITNLQDDLAMSLKASSIRIVAPIPKKGTVGIEVPNRHRELVMLRDVLESDAFINADSILTVPLGEDTYGQPVVADIAKMPHLLVAGATGTGKSVCINSFLVSFLYRASPAELGLILIDPKILELSVYEGIPHLMVPVVTVPKQAKAVLEWAVDEMNRRYRLMRRFKVRSIDGYNKIAKGEESVIFEDESTKGPVVMLSEDQLIDEGNVPLSEDEETTAFAPEKITPLPKIVIVIDELADLMLTVGRDIEDLITRLAQKARAAGIHLIVATQRPSVDVITGLIKANFPARLSFRVSSAIDSRTILTTGGAERLLGRGDMLVQLPGWDHIKRVHGAYVDDMEVQRVVAEVSKTLRPQYDPEILELCKKALEEDNNKDSNEEEDSEFDPLYDRAVQLVIEKGQASASMLQRAFRVGYNRAARIIDTMEREGVVGPMDGGKPREILITSRDLA